MRGKPFLGICLGLQLLFSFSEEGGGCQGLDILKGKVCKLPCDLKVPHMGWNQVTYRKESVMFRGIPDNSFFYFVHSYCVYPEDEAIVCSVTDYGVDFVSSIEKGNVFAVQFHPEKSQDFGLRLILNFGSKCGIKRQKAHDSGLKY
jgi:glutamine amidotransferase